MLLIAADAIERLGEHNVELAISRPASSSMVTGGAARGRRGLG
jgi:hypothetical protein